MLIQHLIAQVSQGSNTWSSVVALGVFINVVLALGMLVRMFSGKSNERQIEPTALAGINNTLKEQTQTLNTINREVGEVKSSVEPIKSSVDGLHQRVGGISRDLAHTVARVDSLEERNRCKS